MKNKQRNRLEAVFPHDMCLALSKTEPRIKGKQAHVSH